MSERDDYNVTTKGLIADRKRVNIATFPEDIRTASCFTCAVTLIEREKGSLFCPKCGKTTLKTDVRYDAAKIKSRYGGKTKARPMIMSFDRNNTKKKIAPDLNDLPSNIQIIDDVDISGDV